MNDVACALTTTVLTENTPREGLRAEHGLSLHLCYAHAGTLTNLLLDFGQSDAFAQNAARLGVDLGFVDMAVLSHAHYDHADGMPAFFEMNDHAQLFLCEACAENCWSTRGGTIGRHYIGIRPGLLDRHADRIQRVAASHMTTIAPGIHLIPHSAGNLAEVGRRSGMLLETNGCWEPDDFSHELSLVLELAPSQDATPRLAVFNSCSHAGLALIAEEVAQAFPGSRIAAYVGGLHLAHASDDQIRQVADAIRRSGIEHLYTGHCTGDLAMAALRMALPGRIASLYPGSTLQLATGRVL